MDAHKEHESAPIIHESVLDSIGKHVKKAIIKSISSPKKSHSDPFVDKIVSAVLKKHKKKGKK